MAGPISPLREPSPFEGREAKGLSKSRYNETFAGEDGSVTA